MIYYVLWMDLLSLSVAISLLVFIWALRSGQFSNQNRARFLPLADEHFDPAADVPPQSKAQRYALLTILFLGVMVLFGPFFVLLK